jgi:hypothetical protein
MTDTITRLRLRSSSGPLADTVNTESRIARSLELIGHPRADIEWLQEALAPPWKRRMLRLDARDDAIRALASTLAAGDGEAVAKKVRHRLARPAGDVLAVRAAELCRGKVLSVGQLISILAGSRS